MKALVIGYQKSGKSASKLLKKLGYRVIIVNDDRVYDKQKIDRLIKDLSFIVVSPGVLPDSAIITKAKELNIKVIGELELGCLYLKGNLIAITGTNGKTTTTSLTKHLLGEDNTFIGGNIGTPVSNFCLNTNCKSTTVCEVSSFQLMYIDKFCPKISVFLNLTPDHINYHKTMQNYLNAKLNIFKNQTSNDFAVLNADDAVVSSIQQKNAKVLYFSTKKRVNGCFASGGNIYFRDTTNTIKGFNKSVKIAKTSDVKLIGEHNLSNALCAITCAIISGIDIKTINMRLQSFKPIEHRLQVVTDIGGVTFINDSKATNTLSTVCAINSMTAPTTLILGGSNKGCSFDDIFNCQSLITNYVLMGETKHIIAQTAKKWGKENIVMANSLSNAVELAYKLSATGSNVLFSPACASYDMFTNFEQRGKCFCGIVRELKRSENNSRKNIKKNKV